MLAGDDPVPLPEYFEGWDPLTDIILERSIRCDPAALRSDSDLEEQVPLTLTVSWVSQQSFMTEAVYRAELDHDQTVRISLPASRVGGSITLRTTITVGSSDPVRPLGSARWAGSLLVSDDRVVVLEGDGPMFPMCEVDFAGTAYPPDASWALQISEDLTLPVLGSILLLINSRDTELALALSAAKPDPRQSALLETMEGQVAAFLIAQAVSRRNELESEEWPDQCTGALLTRYLGVARDRGVLTLLSAADQGVLAAALDSASRAEGHGRSFL
jgi:hypothetical protein